MYVCVRVLQASLFTGWNTFIGGKIWPDFAAHQPLAWMIAWWCLCLSNTGAAEDVFSNSHCWKFAEGEGAEQLCGQCWPSGHGFSSGHWLLLCVFSVSANKFTQLCTEESKSSPKWCTWICHTDSMLKSQLWKSSCRILLGL